MNWTHYTTAEFEIKKPGKPGWKREKREFIHGAGSI